MDRRGGKWSGHQRVVRMALAAGNGRDWPWGMIKPLRGFRGCYMHTHGALREIITRHDGTCVPRVRCAKSSCGIMARLPRTHAKGVQHHSPGSRSAPWVGRSDTRKPRRGFTRHGRDACARPYCDHGHDIDAWNVGMGRGYGPDWRRGIVKPLRGLGTPHVCTQGRCATLGCVVQRLRRKNRSIDAAWNR